MSKQAEKQPIDLNALGIPHGTLFQPAQPEQEPVADKLIRTYVSAAMANNQNLAVEATKEMINYVCSFIENTAAPKREWVSLTDDEYDELLTGDWGGSLIKRVEARLKEKNGG